MTTSSHRGELFRSFKSPQRLPSIFFPFLLLFWFISAHNFVGRKRNAGRYFHVVSSRLVILTKFDYWWNIVVGCLERAGRCHDDIILEALVKCGHFITTHVTWNNCIMFIIVIFRNIRFITVNIDLKYSVWSISIHYSIFEFPIFKNDQNQNFHWKINYDLLIVETFYCF